MDSQIVHVLWRTAIEGGSWRTIRGNSSLRSGARRVVGLPEGPLRRLGGRYTGLHILVHAGIPVVKSRKEEDVLGTVGAEMQIVVRAGWRRGTAGRILRMLQWLRGREPVVGADTGKSVYAESRYGTFQVWKKKRKETVVKGNDFRSIFWLTMRDYHISSNKIQTNN